ncbi:MAG: hypothetical protein AMS25_08110 [Gemmatimonas sp. SM23_52]|nr:MAG: hypothetical protein AMS25_08110 [Gemmatimonas sp. SM23_52]
MLAPRTVAVLAMTAFLMVIADSTETRAQESGFAPDTLVLDLDAARRIGLASSPQIVAARAQIAGARGDRRQAGVYRFNPEFQLKVSSLIDPGNLGSFEGLLTQEFEWAGQWGLRKSAADHGVSVAEGRALDVVRMTVYDIDVAYFRSVAAARRLEVRGLGLELSRRFLEAVRIQLWEGEVSTLEVNLAEIEAGRARAADRSARRALSMALLELTRTLGLPPEQSVRIVDDGAGGPDPRLLDLDSLVMLALASRPDLTATAAEVARAQANRRLATRGAFPNLRISAVAERGSVDEDVSWGLRVGLPLPLWNRNQGLRDGGRAEESRAEAQRAAIELQVRMEVASCLEAYSSASEELEIFDAQVLRPARANQQLLENAYAAGKLDLPTALLLRTQLLEAELGYWDAWLAERTALAALRAAVGDVPTELRPEF